MQVEKLQDSSIMETVNYIDCINYFCEMMTEKELEALRKGELLRRQTGEQVVQAKNTVLVLPKIAQWVLYTWHLEILVFDLKTNLKLLIYQKSQD